MAYLKYYAKEKETYPLHYATLYKTPKDADKVIKKLIRHFKLKQVKQVAYDRREGYGYANSYGIHLPKKNIPLGIICHELGHHLALMKTGKWNHCHKTFMKMKQVFCYAEKFISCCCDDCANLCKENLCDENNIKIDNPERNVCDDYMEDI